MKKVQIILFAVLITMSGITGCDTFLDVNSERIVLPADHQLNSANDTLYSMIGIFSRIEKLMDRYVLLGELRGDLMEVTEHANPHLREIYNFEVSEDNPYNKVSDYYAVINNCNYLIRTIDTALILNAEQVMLKEFAAAKSIRAWTYLQLALNYGTVKYFEHPMLSVGDSSNYIEYTLKEMLPHLIQDLEPWKNVNQPGSVFFGVSSGFLYFPVRFVLGDLYLWNEEYENAAREYYNLIIDRPYINSPLLTSTWTVVNGIFVERELENQNWLARHTGLSSEQITVIAGSKEYGEGAELDSLSWYNYEIAPSDVAFDTWDRQTYYYSAVVNTLGDLRGNFGSYFSSESLSQIGTDGLMELSGFEESYTPITKYTLLGNETSKMISVYRTSLLYLRYAEAVNRAGKPNLAFAVLKHGMSSATMAVDTIVPRNEKFSQYTDTTGIFVDYVNFEAPSFDFNIGIHANGNGNVRLALDYTIPALGSHVDSIAYVEDKIIEELALETAFEGNRYHDLMRIALRRGDPEYLANIVSEKYIGNKEAFRAKLSVEENWYLK